jgi:hypothetical protein
MNTISDSLNKIRLIESQQLTEAPATTVAAPVAAKTGGKLLGKVLPGAGAALSAYDANNRLKAGDKTGAAIAGITGAASLIPGIGTGAAILGTGIQAARDKWRTGSWLPDDEQVAAAAAKDQPAQAAAPAAPADPAQPKVQVPPGGDPKVFALQQQLIAKGAKIKADGKMGPMTQAAMKQFPGIQLAGKINKVKGTVMSESEKIAALRAKLFELDAPAEQLNERNPLTLLQKGRDALSGTRNALANFGRGASGQAPRTATGQFTQAGGATKAGRAVGAATQAVKKNPVTTALATGAAAGTAGYMAGRGNQPQTTNKPPVGGNPAAPAAPAAAAQTAPTAPASSLTTDEEGEMGVLAQEFDSMMGQDPELDKLILQYQKLRPGAADAGP